MLAARHISQLRASSVIDQLREAARQLRVNVTDTDLGVSVGGSVGSVGSGGSIPDRRKITPVYMCLAWMWQLAGRFSRAVTSDRFGWVDRSGLHPSDVIGQF